MTPSTHLPTRSEPLWGLIAIVALVPLPLGSVDTWARAATMIAIWVVFATLIFKGMDEPLSPRLRRWLISSTVLAIAILCWAALQTSGALTAWLSMTPGSAPSMFSETAISIAAIAVRPDQAWDHMLMMLSLVAIFVTAAVCGQKADMAQRVLQAITLIAASYASYGLLMHLGGWQQVLWYEKQAYSSWLTGTFINRNSFATYAGMGVIVTTGLLIERLSNIGNSHRGWASIISSIDRLDLFGWLLLLSFLLSTSALVLTGSRAGAAATALGFLSLLLMLGRQRRTERRFAVFAVLVGTIAIGLHFGQQLSLRWIDALAQENAWTRGKIYETALPLIADRPLTGYGLGSFPDIFERARGASLVGSDAVFYEAHNDYLELAIELGIPVAALACIGIAALVGRCVTGAFVRRRRRVYPAVAAAASVLVGSHALVDFSLQIPAVATTYTVILGIGLGQSFPSQSRTAGRVAETVRESRGSAAPKRRQMS